MSNSLVIARKEFKDILHSGIFLTVLLLLLALTVTSVIVSSFVFKSQVDSYQSSLQILKELGKQPGSPQPELFPLNLLRGVVDYLEIVGAILGILLGNLTIAREKNTQTLKLILTRPVSRKDLLFGKMMGNAVFIGIVLVFVGLFALLSLVFVAGVALTLTEAVKLVLVIAISWIYIMAFISLAAFLSLSMRSLSNALVVAFTIWLVFVLILPQIGDTMDPDNQVPRGFFNSIHFNKEQGKQVLTKFGSYENARNFIEELSVTKHYERTAFALLGIKPEFNGLPVPDILGQKWFDILVVILFFSAGILTNYSVLNKKDILVWD
ncbi:MAG TPA: ABC transporter permease subunit [Candidatus Methanoperedens sp.]|nr:ABC transporter permease subunit [Candidatus Methanoperedens sp.]